jgi:hypothetical protein
MRPGADTRADIRGLLERALELSSANPGSVVQRVNHLVSEALMRVDYPETCEEVEPMAAQGKDQ